MIDEWKKLKKKKKKKKEKEETVSGSNDKHTDYW